MRRSICLPIVLILVWLCAGTASATRELRVGVYQNKPKVFLDEKGQAQGIFIDILRTIADDEGWSLTFVPGTWTECLDRLEIGEIDLMPDVAYSDERAERYDFHQNTILNNWAQVYIPPGSDIGTVLDLEGKRLAVLRDDISYVELASRLHAFGVACQYVEVDQFKEIFELLERGAVDAGLQYEKRYRATRSPIVCCPAELFFAAPKGQGLDILAAIDRHMPQLKADKNSVYYSSLDRWLDTGVVIAPQLPSWIWWTLIGVVGLLAMILIHHRLLKVRLNRMTAELRRNNDLLKDEIATRRVAEDELMSHRHQLEVMVEERTRAYQESEARYRSIFENATMGIFRTSRDGGVLTANPATARMLGYDSAAQVIGEVTDLAAQVYHDPTDREKVLRLMQEKGEATMEVRLKRRDGTPVLCEIRMWMVKDEDGNLQCLEGFLEDITQRKEADERIKLFHRIFMSSSDGINITSPEGCLVEYNPAFIEFLKRPPEDITGCRVAEIVVPEDSERVRQSLEGSGSFNGEVRVVRGDGTTMYVDLSVFPIYKDDGSLTCWVGMGRDMTERRTAELEMRAREAQYRGIFNSVSDGLLIFSPEGVVVEANPAACEMYGYPREEFVGKTGPEFVNERSLPLFEEFKRQLGSDNYFTCETLENRRDGTPFYIEVNGTNFMFKGERHLLAVVRDVTERRRAEDEAREAYAQLRQANEELKSTQYQLVQSEKMASLGMLVAGVAHEINTPFGAVRSMYDTVKAALGRVKTAIGAETALTESGRATFDKMFRIIDESHGVIDEGIGRVSTIVRRLRSFARLDEAELKEADIHECLEDTLTLIHHEIKHNIKVVREYGDLPRINCFPSQLNQVFLNLFINAKQAIKGNGEIRIQTSHSDGFVRVRVIDTGSGMSPDVLRRVFDPGFTTKGVGVGTGLGLSICYQILQDHRGRIDVSSEPGAGSTFTVIIPDNLDESMFEKKKG